MKEKRRVLPDCPYGLINLAACLLMGNKCLIRAEQLLRQADHLLPNHQAIWCNLGRALHAQGRLVEADEAFRKALQLNPSSTIAKAIVGKRPHLARN